MTIATLLAASLLIVGGAGKPDPSAYPELSADALLPPIIADIKRTLPDPYSIRDFLICPATQIKLENGRPIGWTVRFGFNSKNESGGYSGLAAYVVVFKRGQITLHASSSKLASGDALNDLMNRAMTKRLLSCMPVANIKIQELLERPLAGGS